MSEHDRYVDSVVHQRICELLDRMVKEEEIDPPDRDRFLRELDWIQPPELDNRHYIRLVSLLQQQKGEKM